jgi:hypothetical protein
MVRTNSTLSTIAQSPLQKVGVACLLPVPGLEWTSGLLRNVELGPVIILLLVVRLDQSPIILPPFGADQ